MSGDLVVVVVSLVVAGIAGAVLVLDTWRGRTIRVDELERKVRLLERAAAPVAVVDEPVVDELLADPATSCADCYFSGRPCVEHAYA